MFRHRIIAALTAAACIATPLAAQGFIKQLSRIGMTQEDVNLMVAAGAELYTGGNASVGDDTIWQNPQTNAHGLAEITEVDGNCIRIAYRFRTTKQKALQTMETRRCLTNGEWILSG